MKTETIKIRVSPREKADLALVAKTNGMTTTAWVRERLFSEGVELTALSKLPDKVFNAVVAQAMREEMEAASYPGVTAVEKSDIGGGTFSVNKLPAYRRQAKPGALLKDKK